MRISQGSYCAVCVYESSENQVTNTMKPISLMYADKKSTHMWMFMCETKTQWFIMSECEWGSKATEATAYVPYTRTSLPNHILCCDSQTPTYFGWSIILHIITFLGKHVRFATPCRLNIWFQMDVHPGILVYYTDNRPSNDLWVFIAIYAGQSHKQDEHDFCYFEVNYATE